MPSTRDSMVILRFCVVWCPARTQQAQLFLLLFLLHVSPIAPFISFPMHRTGWANVASMLCAKRRDDATTPPAGKRDAYNSVLAFIRKSDSNEDVFSLMNPVHKRYNKRFHVQWKQLPKRVRFDLTRKLQAETQLQPDIICKETKKKERSTRKENQKKDSSASYQALLQSLSGAGNQVLVNKLNPQHADYDANLRQKWDLLPKESRQDLQNEISQGQKRSTRKENQKKDSSASYQALLQSLSGAGNQVLVNKLNPQHADYDESLRQKWNLLSKNSRKDLQNQIHQSLATAPSNGEARSARSNSSSSKISPDRVLSEVGGRMFVTRLNPNNADYDDSLRQKWDQLSKESRKSLSNRIQQSFTTANPSSTKKRVSANVGSTKSGNLSGAVSSSKIENSSTPGLDKVQEEQEQHNPRRIFMRIQNGMEEHAKKRFEDLHWMVREVDFEQRVHDFIDARSLLGGSETAEETRRLESMAAAYGCESVDVMVQQFATVWNSNPEYVRMGLLVVAETLAEKTIEMRQKLKDTTDANPKGLMEEDPFDVIAGRVKGMMGNSLLPRPPSTNEFPSNDEVDEHHEMCRTQALELEVAERQYSGELVKINLSSQPSEQRPGLAGASLEDLSPVTLEQLLAPPPGQNKQPIHALKLELVVVRSAFVFRAVTAIVADRTGQHVRIAVYNTGAKSNSDAQRLLPVGAHIVLKQPFLKRCADNWLGLRVDVPATLVRCDPPLLGRVLVVGDGDFSFSLALAERNVHAQITATSLDDKKTVTKKYSKASANLAVLKADKAVKVMHGIDATRLQKTLRDRGSKSACYDMVVWNFPYPVGVTTANSTQSRQLVTGFFESVKDVLSLDGQVRMLLAQKQGGSSRDVATEKPNWSVETAAFPAGFDLLEVVPFNASLFPKYRPRREFVDRGFPSQDARVYIFGQRDPQTPAHSQERHFTATLSSLLDHVQDTRTSATTPSGGQPLKLEAFARHAGTSVVARRMVDAGEACQDAVAMVRLLLADADHSLETVAEKWAENICSWVADPHAHRRIPMPVQIVQLLEKCYNTDGGELVAEWPDVGVLNAAFGCTEIVARAAMAQSCGVLSPGQHEAHEMTELRKSLVCADFDEVLLRASALQIVSQRMADGGWLAPLLSSDAAAVVASCLFVRANLLMQANRGVKVGLQYLALSIDMGIAHAPTFRRSAQLLCFVSNQVQHDRELHRKALGDVVEDSNRALELDPDDNAALFTKAFALRSGDASDYKKAFALYELYLSRTEQDDRNRPDAHYHAGCLACLVCALDADKEKVDQAMEGAMARGRRHYQQGFAAEAERLPCFPPVRGGSKQLLSLMLQAYGAYQTGKAVQGTVSSWFNMFRRS